MNLMKLIINNIYFIWITLFVIICFFVQTYYEIENYENYENYENNKMLESQVKKNTKKIESLNAITMIQNLKIEVAKLKNDMGKGIKNNSKSINDLKTTLEGYKKQLITSMTPTNSEETQNN